MTLDQIEASNASYRITSQVSNLRYIETNPLTRIVREITGKVVYLIVYKVTEG